MLGNLKVPNLSVSPNQRMDGEDSLAMFAGEREGARTESAAMSRQLIDQYD